MSHRSGYPRKKPQNRKSKIKMSEETVESPCVCICALDEDSSLRRSFATIPLLPSTVFSRLACLAYDNARSLVVKRRGIKWAAIRRGRFKQGNYRKVAVIKTTVSKATVRWATGQYKTATNPFRATRNPWHQCAEFAYLSSSNGNWCQSGHQPLSPAQQWATGILKAPPPLVRRI